MRRALLLTVSAAILASACARGSSPLAAPTTVRVGEKDGNRTITIHVADTLVIELGAPQPARLLRWRLLAYPTRVLQVVKNEEEKGVFWLVAKAIGRGRVVVVSSVNCGGGPLPAAGAPCPAVGGDLGESPSSTPPGPPSAAIALRQFSITVVVA